MSEHSRHRAQPDRAVADGAQRRAGGEAADAPHVALVQQLQRSAGNHAVAALVEQDPSALTLARKAVLVNSGYFRGGIEVGKGEMKGFEADVSDGYLDVDDDVGGVGNVEGAVGIEGATTVEGAVDGGGVGGVIEGIVVPPGL